MFKSRQQSSIKEISDLLFMMAYFAEVKEWDNRTHLKRIQGYTFLVCLRLDIPRDEAEQISVASQLHDIGKVHTPIELLMHEGNYSTIEWQTMEKHTTDGAELLKASPHSYMKLGAIIAETHHERWDGSGYPAGLSGENIPLSGRIYALVDVFDALTTPRPYKETMPEFQAVDRIRNAGGTLFDPRVVQGFLDSHPGFSHVKETAVQ